MLRSRYETCETASAQRGVVFRKGEIQSARPVYESIMTSGPTSLPKVGLSPRFRAIGDSTVWVAGFTVTVLREMHGNTHRMGRIQFVCSGDFYRFSSRKEIKPVL